MGLALVHFQKYWLLRFSTVVYCACAGGIKNLFFVLAILTVRLLFLGDFLFLSFEGSLSRGLKIRFFYKIDSLSSDLSHESG